MLDLRGRKEKKTVWNGRVQLSINMLANKILDAENTAQLVLYSYLMCLALISKSDIDFREGLTVSREILAPHGSRRKQRVVLSLAWWRCCAPGLWRSVGGGGGFWGAHILIGS